MCWKALAILLMEMMWGNSPSSASSPPWMRTPPMVETISRLSRRREKVILEPGSNILDKRWEVTDVKGLVIICTLHTIYICHCKQKQVTKVLCFWNLFQTNNRYISCSPENSQLKLSFILSHFTITITAHHYTLETKAHSPKVLLGRVRWGTLRRRSWNRPAACRPASAKDSGVDLVQLGKIADISHNRHNQRWCTFFKPV